MGLNYFKFLQFICLLLTFSDYVSNYNYDFLHDTTFTIIMFSQLCSITWGRLLSFSGKNIENFISN